MTIFGASNQRASRRAFICGVAALLTACAAHSPVARTTAATPRILFVCQFGTVKSAIAREHLRRRAAERGIALSVQSRGVTPEDHLAPSLAKALVEDRIVPGTDPLTALAPDDLAKADVVVLFDKLPASFGAVKARDWSDLPSMNADYTASRGDLIGRLDRLLDELPAARK